MRACRLCGRDTLLFVCWRCTPGAPAAAAPAMRTVTFPRHVPGLMQARVRTQDDLDREASEAAAWAFWSRYRRGVCLNCGRKLTDPLSVERRIGPECWRQGARA